QQVTEEIVLKMVRALHAETGLDRLCLAGGVALNSVANGRIIRETPVRDIFIQPAAGDGGGALGAALYAYHCALGKPRQFLLRHAYWGEEVSQGAVNGFARGCGMPWQSYGSEDQLLDAVVGELCAGHVVGWFQGRFEWGPRALGSRSIIADPRRADMKEIVNVKIKFREPFRPFAPSVLAERAGEYFDLGAKDGKYPSRFMLNVTPMRAAKQP